MGTFANLFCTQQDALCDLLVKPALVKHGIVEVDGLSVAAELHIVANCLDAQLQVPLGVLHHGAAGLGVRVNNLHAQMHDETKSNKFVCEFSQHFAHSGQQLYLILHVWLWCRRSQSWRIQPLHRPLSVVPVDHLVKRLLEFHLAYLAVDQLAAKSHWFF